MQTLSGIYMYAEILRAREMVVSVTSSPLLQDQLEGLTDVNALLQSQAALARKEVWCVLLKMQILTLSYCTFDLL